MSIKLSSGMRALWLTALFALSALGAYLLTRAIDDLVPDRPAPVEIIDLDWANPPATPPGDDVVATAELPPVSAASAGTTASSGG